MSPYLTKDVTNDETRTYPVDMSSFPSTDRNDKLITVGSLQKIDRKYNVKLSSASRGSELDISKWLNK